MSPEIKESRRSSPTQVEDAWAAHERGVIAARLGLPWSEDDGYEGTLTENETLRRAFAKKGCLPTSKGSS
jgi:hypothetical protein